MNLNPKVAISDDFMRAFSRLTREHQSAVLSFLTKFRQNPMASGINYEKIHLAADANIHSVRINQDIRGIVLKPDQGQVYCLLWVDHHDDAYQWARRHRVSVHPDVGSLQVYSVAEYSAEHVEQLTPSTKPLAKGVFDALKDREIRKLGVPDELLTAVRQVQDESDLDQIQNRLPDVAYEALFMYMAGDSYDAIVAGLDEAVSVDVTDYATALDHLQTQRHFVVLSDDSDLEALMSAPLEHWRIFLHPSQKKLIQRDWSGPVRVSGGAGTGKTVVAMHRAAYLARQYRNLAGKPILFMTYTRTLAEDIRQHLALLCTPQELDKIQVLNTDQWALSVLRRFGYKFDLLYDEQIRRQLWDNAITVAPADIDLNTHFYRAEYERVVMPQGCSTAEEYMRASRLGRGAQLGRTQRRAIWPVFAEYRAQLYAKNLKEPEEAFLDARDLLAKGIDSLGIRCMIIDECQDISAAAYQLIRAAIPAQPNDLFIVGDAHQRIYRHKVVLSRVGIDVVGRARTLKINYRTTDEVRKWACAQLENCLIEELDGEAGSLKGYKSLMHGDLPKVIESTQLSDDMKQIEKMIDLLKLMNEPLSQFCITTRTNNELQEYERILLAKQIPLLKLDRDTPDDQTKEGVRLATMHRIKGLEFNIVCIAGYQGVEKYAHEYAKQEDSGVVADLLTNERCLLHVASTRARKSLLVINRS
jgi:superfamily I DNA/RNA helicase